MWMVMVMMMIDITRKTKAIHGGVVCLIIME